MVHIDAYVVLICVSSWRHPNDFHPNLLNFRSYLPFSKISFSSVQMICVSLQVFFVKHTDWLKLPFQFQGQAVVIFLQSSSFINQGTKVEILWHGSLCHLGETKKRPHSHEPSALIWGFPKMVFFPPKSSILIGCSIIFTILLGVPLFLETPIWKLIRFRID